MMNGFCRGDKRDPDARSRMSTARLICAEDAHCQERERDIASQVRIANVSRVCWTDSQTFTRQCCKLLIFDAPRVVMVQYIKTKLDTLLNRWRPLLTLRCRRSRPRFPPFYENQQEKRRGRWTTHGALKNVVNAWFVDAVRPAGESSIPVPSLQSTAWYRAHSRMGTHPLTRKITSLGADESN